MTISGAFANARSGLTLNARAAELVSSNIANALTPNHARQDIVASTNRTGGVGVGQVVRASAPLAMATRLSAQAEADARMTSSAGQTRIAQVSGAADGSSGLAADINALGIALSQAAISPNSTAALQSVMASASNAAQGINEAATELRAIRNQADASIAARVEGLNTGLVAIDDLNSRIVAANARRENTAAMQQERDGYILDIANHIPLTVIDRGEGQVAIFSQSGAALLDGTPAKFEFSPRGVVGDGATIADGTVSGVTLNGLPMDEGPRGLLSGGGLAADFELRDQIVPKAQADLDLLAASLMQRLEGADPTLAPGEPGLISDGASGFDLSNQLGLASRLSMNPDLGNPILAFDLLRGGFGVAPDPSLGLLGLMTSALTRLGTDLSPTGDSQARDMAGHLAQFSGNLHSASYRAEQSGAQASARALSAQANHAAQVGVDSDQQLQYLMQIENAYAANARVLATADAMMQQLLEI